MKKETRDNLNLLYMIAWAVVIGAVVVMFVFNPMEESCEARMLQLVAYMLI
jgi:hypothetical protein